MIQPKEILGSIHAGDVLDVATGSGGFIHFLVEGLGEYSHITGVDTNTRALSQAEANFQGERKISFITMDALGLEYPDATFDTVTLANSLHHFDCPELVLKEMMRVLRPGGNFIVAEMYRDGQSDTQISHVLLHHWWAAVDRTQGVVHNNTYQRDEIVSLIGCEQLDDVQYNDLSETEDDPKAPEVVAELDSIIDRYIQRAEGHPDLQKTGANLRDRVHQIGFHGASSLLVIGKKHVPD